MLLLLAVLLAPAPVSAQRVERVTFFENTQYPLTAWFIEGDEPGPTIMVQGGIQGDEKAGFLTAQLLTAARVRKGRLIIVPRANVPSINVSQRQVNVDLNRRFDKKYNQFYEDRLALAIRFLVSKATAFIHLHEGSGFYHPTYVDDLRNPLRYGQSIIIDTMIFENRINLAETVSQVLSELNP
ncbi:MAG: M99 family carboxypeptidase catalytic domain-containing protein, partial [Desulfovibrionaceae bacterium]